MTARGAYREILAIRDARRLIAASAVSQLGDWLFNAALLGTVYASTGSARWVGAATICRLLPYVVLGPAGRPGRRPLRPASRPPRRRRDTGRADARPGRGGEGRRAGGARPRADGSCLGRRDGRAPRGNGPAAARGRRWPPGAGERPAAHGAGPRSGRRAGDRGRAPGRGAERGRVPRQRAHLRGVGGARLDAAPPRRPGRHARGRERRLPFPAGPSHRAGDAVRRPAADRDRHGRADLRRPDRAARRLRRPAPRSRGRGLRLPPRRRRCGRRAERLDHAPARDEHASLRRRGRHRCALLRHATRLCRGRRARLRAGGDADRRRGLRGLRGGRRDDARPPGSCRGPGAPDGRRRGGGGRCDGGGRAPGPGPARLDVAPRQPVDPRAGRRR